MATLILPEQIDTASTQRGRAVLLEIMDRVLELHDRGLNPQGVEISTALADDMRAFFDAASDFDGVLPKALCGVPLRYTPGASRTIHYDLGTADQPSIVLPVKDR